MTIRFNSLCHRICTQCVDAALCYTPHVPWSAGLCALCWTADCVKYASHFGEKMSVVKGDHSVRSFCGE